jgi:hypothetical protein
MDTLFTILKWYAIVTFTASVAWIALFEIRHRRSLAYAKVRKHKHRPF